MSEATDRLADRLAELIYKIIRGKIRIDIRVDWDPGMTDMDREHAIRLDERKKMRAKEKKDDRAS